MVETRPYRMDRRARSVEETRRRILSAARTAFLAEPYDGVRLADVAATAGVSQQTLLNHFTSKENLFVAVLGVLGAEIEAARSPVPPGDTDAAVAELVREYEEFGDANVRFVLVAERMPAVLGDALAGARAAHARWLEDVFGGELPQDPLPRRRALAALYAATDVGTWKLLRRDLGHSRTETAAAVRLAVGAVLTAARRP
ncbi:hypothetical protein NUM3379_13780 [Kineococcus sp. NUM-3379]